MADSPPLPSVSSSSIPQNHEVSTGLNLDRNETLHLNVPSRPILSTGNHAGRSPYHGGFWDPRSSSTQSLRPIESAGSERRILLLIYLHGFLGDETTFKSFPAHLHNVLTASLVETHVVHTKIYPRYKSRNHISFARDDFSSWLAPHEDISTDVILIGHSLGGILAAEVVLQPCIAPNSKEFFQHRILGLVAFDTPFLGMHPGVVKTGIASLFRSSPETQLTVQSSSNEIDLQSSSDINSSPGNEPSGAQPVDPNYNPSYTNDVKLANRKGRRQRAWYFWNKHSNNLFDATQSYLTSHLEFGGCLADYPGLRKRYDAVRSLDDINEFNTQRWEDEKIMRRVRFVNYYSASTGVIKERKPEDDEKKKSLTLPKVESNPSRPSLSLATSTSSDRRSPMLTPRLSVEEYQEGYVVAKDLEEDKAETAGSTPDQERTIATEETVHKSSLSGSEAEISVGVSRNELEDLPPLLDLPEVPKPFEPTQYNDKDVLKTAKKEHERQMKTYNRALKDRQKSISGREKIMQKRRKAVEKQEKKTQKLLEKEKAKSQTESSQIATGLNSQNLDKGSIDNFNDKDKSRGQVDRKVRVRKFCALPPADITTGARDALWIRVNMEGMDEVVAHMAMFNESETYAAMVGNVAHRVEGWLQEDATSRVLHDEMTA